MRGFPAIKGLGHSHLIHMSKVFYMSLDDRKHKILSFTYTGLLKERRRVEFFIISNSSSVIYLFARFFDIFKLILLYLSWKYSI